jgi:hypothetical protein
MRFCTQPNSRGPDFCEKSFFTSPKSSDTFFSLSLSLVQSQQKSDIDSQAGQLTVVKHLPNTQLAIGMTIREGKLAEQRQ